jgi:hypothetical protein
MSDFFDTVEQRLRQSAAQVATAPRRPWWRRRVALVVALAALVGFAVPAVAAITTLWTPDVPPQRPWRVTTGQSYSCDGLASRPRSTTTTRPVSPQLTSQLAALRRPRGAADRVDARYLRTLPVIGLNRAAIRRLAVSANGSDVYVIPVEGIAGERPWPARCLDGLPRRLRRQFGRGTPDRVEPMLCVLDGGGSSCGLTASDLRRRGSFGAATVGRGDTLVTGIVPDGVTAVTVAYGRSKRAFAVHDNVVSFMTSLSPERASSPDQLQWQLADGTTRTIPTHGP